MQQVSCAAHRALLCYSRAVAVDFYTAPGAVPFVEAEIARAVAGCEGGPAHACGSVLDYLAGRSALPDLWFDVGGDSTRPFRARRRAGGDYPIALVHHSLSYGYLLHQWFLPLLLGDVRACDSVLCTSPSGRRVVEKILEGLAEDFNAEHGARLRYRGRLDEVPLGVDADFFRPRSRQEARAALGWRQDETVILWVGRLSAHDKADLVPLLRVFRQIVEDLPWRDLRLVLVGSSRGDEHQALGRVVSDLDLAARVTAVPPVPDAKLPLLYSACDVFVSPVDSVQEMFGLTVLEAMACGAAVACSDWGGYRDSVVDGETGVLLPTIMSEDSTETDDLGEWLLTGDELLDGYAHAQSVAVDPGAMHAALVDLVDHPEKCARLGQAARERVAKEFSWPVVVGRWDDLFEDLRRAPPGPPRAVRPYSRPRTAGAFSHYPTRLLGADARVEVGDAGEVRDPRPHMRWIDLERAREVLAAVREAGSVRVGALAPDARALRHVLWLVKYGHLRVCP